jgi:hypothetical protein
MQPARSRLGTVYGDALAIYALRHESGEVKVDLLLCCSRLRGSRRQQSE